MKLRWIVAAIAAMAAHSSGAAAEFREYPDLPPQAMVQQVLQNYPSVLAAQSGIKMGEAARDRLRHRDRDAVLTIDIDLHPLGDDRQRDE